MEEEVRRGVLFIAAGKDSGSNRVRSLEQGVSPEEIKPFIPADEQTAFRDDFPHGSKVYLWGATDNVQREPRKTSPGDWVVDVCNDRIVQAFRFSFWFTLTTPELQTFMNWDADRKRPSRQYVVAYLLRSPVPILNRTKAYFAEAFDLQSVAAFARGQAHYSYPEIRLAIKKAKTKSIEEFLGIAQQ